MLAAEIALPLEQHGRATPPDRVHCALKYAQIRALRIHLDEGDLLQRQLVECDCAHIAGLVADRLEGESGGIRYPAVVRVVTIDHRDGYLLSLRRGQAHRTSVTVKRQLMGDD